ncbi:MAG TPA: hypothetical protein VHB73_05630 [Alphaproteobacteria bacterium]|nr:hypothetical protein [Alphaproteobacteria bacterium]
MPSSSQSMLFACGMLLGVALTVLLFAGHAQAQRVIGAYYIAAHSNPNAIAGVFRVNQNTGYVSYCYLIAGGKTEVTCTRETP